MKVEPPGKSVEVVMGLAGTYAAPTFPARTTAIIRGLNSTGANFIISGQTFIASTSNVTLQDMTINNPSSTAYTITSHSNSIVTVSNVALTRTASTVASHLYAAFGSQLNVIGALTITGNAYAFSYCSNCSIMQMGSR